MVRRFSLTRPLLAIRNAWKMGRMRIARLDLARYEDVAARISLDRSREGTDGVCCFLTPRETVPKPRTTDRCLIVGSITDDPGAATLPALLRDEGLPIRSRSDACVELLVQYRVQGDRLLLHLGCGIHDTRPQVCRDYPANAGGTCTYEKYATTPLLQAARAGFAALFLYCFAQDLYPDLAPFALGEAVRRRRRYWLIPVPVARNKACGFCGKAQPPVAGLEFSTLVENASEE